MIFSTFFAGLARTALVCGLAWSLAAQAGQFSISPVRIYMTAKDRATAITLVNEGDTELVMQADIYQWKQKPNGEDDLTLSEDMILAPPIIKLAPRARQVVRLALLKPLPAGQQHHYRMIVREIPEALPPVEGAQVQIALAFSLPVFITPPELKRNVVCTAQRSAPTAVQVACDNQGGAHALISQIKLLGDAGEVLALREQGYYLLPGNQRSFSLERASTLGPLPAGKLRLQLSHDDASVQVFDITLAP
jgi:fimbrial chaperone protein